MILASRLCSAHCLNTWLPFDILGVGLEVVLPFETGAKEVLDGFEKAARMCHVKHNLPMNEQTQW